MIRAGDILENPVTGETLVFHETSHETNGGAVALEAILRPGAFVPAAHVHPLRLGGSRPRAGALNVLEEPPAA